MFKCLLTWRKRKQGSRCGLAQREDEEEEREYLLRRGGVRERERGDLRLGGGDRRLIMGGDLRRIMLYLGGERHRGGGPRLMGMGGKGERRRGGTWRGINTGAAVISCPSICPPSMCFIAFSASSGFSKSM